MRTRQAVARAGQRGAPADATAAAGRYLTLDVFRGMTVALMILVNNPGSWSHVYPPLRHAQWHGCTPTDLVFPFFLFIVGVSMSFSFAKYGNRLDRDSLLKIAKRALLIFAIGLFLNSFPQWTADWSELRYLGVLQRIALAYGFGALLVLSVNEKFLPWVGGAILLVYWLLLHALGGADPYSLKENYALALDRVLLGENHLYGGFGLPFDPEGLFSTIPAVVTVILGYLVGALIRRSERTDVPRKLLIPALGAVAVGWIWGLVLPINKPLWTSSYVLYTAGWAALLLSLLIWVVDLKGHSKWTSFLVVFGVNPLFIFALAGVWAKVFGSMMQVRGPEGKMVSASSWFYSQVCVPLLGDLNGSLLFAILHVLVFWVIGLALYRNKIFIKV